MQLLETLHDGNPYQALHIDVKLMMYTFIAQSLHAIVACSVCLVGSKLWSLIEYSVNGCYLGL